MKIKQDAMGKLKNLGFREGPKYFNFNTYLKVNKETRDVVVDAYGARGNVYVPDKVIDLVEQGLVEKD